MFAIVWNSCNNSFGSKVINTFAVCGKLPCGEILSKIFSRKGFEWPQIKIQRESRMKRRLPLTNIVRHIRRNMLAYSRVFAFLGISSFITGWLHLEWFYFPLVAVIFGTSYYLGSGGWRYVLIVIQTLPRDLRSDSSL